MWVNTYLEFIVFSFSMFYTHIHIVDTKHVFLFFFYRSILVKLVFFFVTDYEIFKKEITILLVSQTILYERWGGI